MKLLYLKSVAILCVFVMFPLCAGAQSKVNVFLDYQYRFGLHEKLENYSISRGKSHMYGNALHLSALYNFTKQFSAGAGIGADRYESPGYNTFPLFASVHFSPFKRHAGFYVFTNIGYALFAKQGTYNGWMFDVGIGYKKMFSRHFGLNFQLGYNWKQFKGGGDYGVMVGDVIQYKKADSYRSSLTAGVGLIF
ncbi:hypothetical protein [Bacteroides uniformis]|uniref:hypothetical protein n=1 Tax=Bacteroides uniformis TaxID=820 RepID=UPI0039B4C64E